MEMLRNSSIGRKLTLIIVVTSGIVLLLGCLAVVSYDLMTFREAMVRDSATLADVIGRNCTAALAFRDPQAAEDVLSALRAEPNVTAAAIYTNDGQLFAQYLNDGTTFYPPPRGEDGSEFA